MESPTRHLELTLGRPLQRADLESLIIDAAAGVGYGVPAATYITKQSDSAISTCALKRDYKNHKFVNASRLGIEYRLQRSAPLGPGPIISMFFYEDYHGIDENMVSDIAISDYNYDSPLEDMANAKILNAIIDKISRKYRHCKHIPEDSI